MPVASEKSRGTNWGMNATAKTVAFTFVKFVKRPRRKRRHRSNSRLSFHVEFPRDVSKFQEGLDGEEHQECDAGDLQEVVGEVRVREDLAESNG